MQPAWLAVLDDVIEEVPAERPASGRGATRKQSTALNYKGMTPAQIAACGGNKKLMDELFALAIASAEAFRTEHKADIMTGVLLILPASCMLLHPACNAT